MPASDQQTEAFQEFRRNIEYARDLVKGGRRLEQLKVGAFDVGDMYRAAWVQAVAALDHWVYRELVERAVELIQQPSAARPEKFKKISISIELFEDVHHHAKPLDQAFRAHAESFFQFLASPNPDKIQTAFSHVKNGKLWPKVADILTEQRDDGTTITSQTVVGKLRDIVDRRNKIAHQSDRDPANPSGRRAINAADTSESIDWIELIGAALLYALDGPTSPINGTTDQSSRAAPRTAPLPPHADKRTKKKISGTVQDLIEAGLLAPGQKIVSMSPTWPAEAIVLPDGTIELNGRQFTSLSSATTHVTGNQVNGWNFWGIYTEQRKISLNELRLRLPQNQ